MVTQTITWEYLTTLEPRLLGLERRVKAIRDIRSEPRFCANDLWLGTSERKRARFPAESAPVGQRVRLEPIIINLADVEPRPWNRALDYGFRADVRELVGWFVSRDANPALRTQTAFNLVHRRLHAMLPNCRNCTCWGDYAKPEPRAFNAGQRRQILERAGGACQMCGIDLGGDWHADHIEPWIKGGATSLENAAALCESCNLLKRAMQANVDSAFRVLTTILGGEQLTELAAMLDDYLREMYG